MHSNDNAPAGRLAAWVGIALLAIVFVACRAGFGNGGHDGSERSTEKAAPHDSQQRAAAADVASCCSASAPRR